MRTEELLDIVKERGLHIEITDGKPMIGPKGPMLTTELMDVLLIHRERIVTKVVAMGGRFPNPQE
jgi:hypothetical protein